MTNYLRKELGSPLEEEVEERLFSEVVKVHDVVRETCEVVVAVLMTTILCTCLKCNLLHVRSIRQRTGHCLLKLVLVDELDS